MIQKHTCIILLLVLGTSFSFATWESIGPFGGPLRAVAVAPNNDNIIYVATYSNPSTIYKSTDAGSTWSMMNSLNYYVYCIAIDPTDTDIVYAGSYQCVYKSTDGGSTWSTHNVSNNYVYDLAIRPDSPAEIYGSGRTTSGSYDVMGFLKSTNGGQSWSETPLHAINNGSAFGIAIDQSQPNTVYISGYYYSSGYYPKVYKSTNSGSTFSDMSSGISDSCIYVYSVTVHPTNSNIVYAGSYYYGIYRSTDGGGLWQRVNPGQFVSCFATTALEPQTVFAGTDTIIYKSTDAGASWFISGTGYGGRYKYSRDLAASNSTAGTIYTVDNTGCCKTTNNGGSWFDSNYGMALASIATFGVSPSQPSVIYTEFEEVCIFRTDDCGDNWSMLPATLDCGTICEFAIDYTNPDIVLALEGTG